MSKSIKAAMKIGVLGGTFDPIHNGHLGIADAACRELGLDRVLFVPARDPWQKGLRDVTPAHDRFEMVKLAISGHSRYDISRVDLQRYGPSYTVDTLSDLKCELGAGAELYFILGMDALGGLPDWREPERIVQMCRVVVAKRPGVDIIDLKALEARLPGISGRVVLINNDLYDINSTGIRRSVADGHSISGLVPDAVALYILENGLYLEEA
jgi:nicotinate-nucleotide adenylyltransferase